jgi:hypothetical protein
MSFLVGKNQPAISDKSLFSLRGEQSKMNYMDRRENQIALFNSLSRGKTPKILCQNALSSAQSCLYARMSELLPFRQNPLPNDWTLPAFCREVIGDTDNLPIVLDALR